LEDKMSHDNFVYLDNAATTAVEKEVIDSINLMLSKEYGNASSIYSFGQQAREILEKSRKIIADSVVASTSEVIFTSGGTESNNYALKGIAFANREIGNNIITQKTEHPAILNVCKYLEKNGFSVTYLGVDKEGFVNPDDLKKALTEKTILVTIMQGNNEIGTIQPISDIVKVIREYETKIKRKIYFHTDACQSYTKTSLDMKKMDIDMITINAHKLHGPKGVGALILRKGTKIDIYQHGGGQESGKRSGTENSPGIVGFGKAVEMGIKNHDIDFKHMTELRDYMIEKVLSEIAGTRLNGPKGDKRLCNNINISFEAIEGESVLLRLSERGIMASTGSACSSNSLEPSHVLTAIGLRAETAHSSMRMTLSRHTTRKDIDYTISVLKEEIAFLRKMSPFWKG